MRSQYPVFQLYQGTYVADPRVLFYFFVVVALRLCHGRLDHCPHGRADRLLALPLTCVDLPSHQANVTCTPSMPAPARKRRRPNQDLQERLARCEQLLKQYADGSGPSPSPMASQSPAMNGSLPDAPAATPTNSESQSRWRPAGKMVKDEGGVRFMDSYLWASIHDEVGRCSVALRCIALQALDPG